ncbi:hypothetical protein, partial [Bradyrhizobium sp. UFLA06-06]
MMSDGSADTSAVSDRNARILDVKSVRNTNKTCKFLKTPNVGNGSWPCKNGLAGQSILKPKLGQRQAA